MGSYQIHYRKTHVCRVPGSLPSAESQAIGKATICRVPNNMHSANNWHSAEYHFAECRPVGTRQRHTLPSAGQLTLSKYRHVHRTHPQTTVTVGAAFVCRVPHSRHSANSVTCPAHAVATNVPIFPQTLPLLFAECQLGNTRQKHASPSVSLGHSANIL